MSIIVSKTGHLKLTLVVEDIRGTEDTKHYHYSNEINMINSKHKEFNFRIILVVTIFLILKLQKKNLQLIANTRLT